MKYQLKTTKLNATPDLLAYIESKIGTLDRYIGSVSENSAVEAWVEIENVSKHHQSGDIYRAEVQIRLPRKSVRAEALAPSVNQAIDEVREEIQQELKKIKDKTSTRQRKEGIKLKQIKDSL